MRKSESTLATRSPALQGLFNLQAAGAREVDLDLLADAAGAGGEDDDAVAEIDGFVDVVGDEDDGLAGALPQAGELFLALRVASLTITAPIESPIPTVFEVQTVSGTAQLHFVH